MRGQARSFVEIPGRDRGTTFVALRLASLAQDDPSIFRQNPEQVAPGHGRGPSRGGDPTEITRSCLI